MLIVQRPQINEEQVNGNPNRSRFVVEPLEPGFGHTLGNTLRRALLSRIPGAAATSLYVEGVQHEFSTIEGVVEDVVELILNIKGIVFRMPEGGDTLPVTLTYQGPGEATAGDLVLPAGLEVVNKDHHLATVSKRGRLELEMHVGPGVGYRSSEQNKLAADNKIGEIPIDSIFSPVQKVAYRVNNTQVGQMTNFDSLVLDVQTNGAIQPKEAVSSAAKTLSELMGLLADLGEGTGLMLGDLTPTVSDSTYDLPIEALDLSERARNCLRRAQINQIGDVIQKTPEELLNITNFGQKSLEELQKKLDDWGLSLASSPGAEDSPEQGRSEVAEQANNSDGDTGEGN